MADQTNDHSTSAKFSEAAEPSLRAVLTHQAELIQSGKLKTINRAEWGREIEETERIFERSRHVARKL